MKFPVLLVTVLIAIAATVAYCTTGKIHDRAVQLKNEQEEHRMLLQQSQQKFEDDLERIYKKQQYMRNFEQMLKDGK